MPYNHELRRGHRAPDAIAAALAKRAFVRATPYLVTAACQPAFPLAPNTPMVQPTLPAVRRHSAEQPSELITQAAQPNAGAASLVGASGAAEPQQGGRPVQSLAERFKEMRRTVMERLTCGAAMPALQCVPLVMRCNAKVMEELMTTGQQNQWLTWMKFYAVTSQSTIQKLVPGRANLASCMTGNHIAPVQARARSMGGAHSQRCRHQRATC